MIQAMHVNTHTHTHTMQYIFSLECSTRSLSDSQVYQSLAEMSVIVNSHPRSQSSGEPCTVSPTRGLPLTGRFSYECHQFADIDTPLWYQFGFKVLSVSQVSMLYVHTVYTRINTYIHERKRSMYMELQLEIRA
jgi:hypothetical protein